MQLDRKCEIGVYDGQSENVSLLGGGGVNFKSAFYCPKTLLNKVVKKIRNLFQSSCFIQIPPLRHLKTCHVEL